MGAWDIALAPEIPPSGSVSDENGVRILAIRQGLNTEQQNPTSRLPLHVLGAAEIREQLAALRRQGLSYRAIAQKLGLGLGTVTRTPQERSSSA
jgi:hypothetical protein